MDETRYSFEVLDKVSVYPVDFMERRRRNLGISWHPKGYTLEEARAILGGSIKPRNKINPRAYKALELWDKLNAPRTD